MRQSRSWFPIVLCGVLATCVTLGCDGDGSAEGGEGLEGEGEGAELEGASGEGEGEGAELEGAGGEGEGEGAELEGVGGEGEGEGAEVEGAVGEGEGEGAEVEGAEGEGEGAEGEGEGQSGCGPWPGGGCADGQVCDVHGCGLGAGGYCVVKPDACPHAWDPVCGCDGRTFANDCERLLAGAALDHVGACPEPAVCGGIAGAECLDGQVCDIRLCVPDAQGVCVPRLEVCGEVYAPVCGCNGQTYPNDCVRLWEGMPLDHVGACDAQVCGPFPGGQCDEDEVCDMRQCRRGGSGFCVARPAACDLVYDPVCGCDRVTYGNDCERLRAGAALDHPGECNEQAQCGGIGGLACPDGQTCDIRECGFDLLGRCVPTPQECVALFQPVCGCDGQTYGNDCERLVAGVALAHEGACELPDRCGPWPGGGCPDGLFCDVTGCGLGAGGVCAVPPQGCFAVHDPVCGCDGQTYSNDCLRQQAQVALDHPGACDADICGGFVGRLCPEGQTCDIRECGADLQGVCVPTPQGCADVEDPVCGCDGVTYSSNCTRLEAGAALDHPGPCQVAHRCGPFPGGNCPEQNEICDIHGCGDGAGGLCVVRPRACPELWAPVCGCDGQTYSSDCHRLAAGVAQDHVGECRQEQ